MITFKYFFEFRMKNLKKQMDAFPGACQALFLTVIAFAVWLVYAKTLSGGFVFDDWSLILHNPDIRLTDFGWTGVANILTDLRPVSTLTFAFNHMAHAYDYAGYHIVNIGVHIITGILLFFFTKTTLGLPSLDASYGQHKQALAYAVCLLWLFNPVNTQSVSYIVQRQNSMAAMFCLGAMLFYAHGRLAKKKAATLLLMVGGLASGALAFGSKENAFALPAFILIYEWFFFQNATSRWFIRFCLAAMGGAAAVAAFLYFFLPGMLPLGIINDGYDIYAFTMEQRLLTELRVLVYYITLIFFPHPSRLNIDIDFPYSSSWMDPPTTLVSFFLIAGLLALAVALARKKPLLSFCVLWFFGSLLMESSVVPLDIIFEHRLYLPSMSVILMAVLLCHRYIPGQKIKVGVFCVILSVFSIWTCERNGVWAESPMSIYKDSAAKSPEKARPFYNVGCEYAKLNRPKEAVLWLKRSVGKRKELKWNLAENLKKDPDFKAIRGSREFLELYEKTVGHQ